MRYLALHFVKVSQAPPSGWKGKRFFCSEGYFAGTATEAREAAKRSIRFKREVWKAEQRGAASAAEAEIEAGWAIDRAEAETWGLVQLVRDRPGVPDMVEPVERRSSEVYGRCVSRWSRRLVGCLRSAGP